MSNKSRTASGLSNVVNLGVNLALAITLVIATACSREKETSTQEWNDFVQTNDAHLPDLSQKTKDIADCETKIPALLCLVDPMSSPGSTTKARECLPGGETYKDSVLKIYRALPGQFQTMFCSLQVVYIEKQTVSIAYAGQASKAGGGRANFIGIRQSILEHDLDLGDVLSWKEQKLFGATADAYETDSHLAFIEAVGPKPSISPLLTYVLLHEMGHLFDYNNGLTRNGWAAGDFSSDGKASRQSPIAKYRNSICFYLCPNVPMQPADATEFYSLLKQSSFLTAYSVVSPMENFAEATANYFLKSVYGLHLAVRLEGSEIYDIGAKYDSPDYAKSKSAVEAFYAGSINDSN